jgi:hypothetical protein
VPDLGVAPLKSAHVGRIFYIGDQVKDCSKRYGMEPVARVRCSSAFAEGRVRILAILLALSLSSVPPIAVAQSAARPSSIAAVTGTVHDSISGGSLAGAMVQLVSADTATSFSSAVVSDSGGRFIFADVPDGRYAIGFLHPLLDSPGVTAPIHTLQVVGR